MKTKDVTWFQALLDRNANEEFWPVKEDALMKVILA